LAGTGVVPAQVTVASFAVIFETATAVGSLHEGATSILISSTYSWFISASEYAWNPK